MNTKFCGGCAKNKALQEFYNNKRKKDGKQTQCKDCMKQQNVINYQKHKISWNKRTLAYNKTEKGRKWRRKYMNNRYKTDKAFNILTRLRSRTREAIRNYGGKKCTSTLGFTGCTIEELCTHLESQFKDGISWQNIKEWDIDHIIPCSSFDLKNEEEQKKCFHYTNLQPLYRIDNMKKSNKIPTP